MTVEAIITFNGSTEVRVDLDVTDLEEYAAENIPRCGLEGLIDDAVIEEAWSRIDWDWKYKEEYVVKVPKDPSEDEFFKSIF